MPFFRGDYINVELRIPLNSASRVQQALATAANMLQTSIFSIAFKAAR